MAHSRNLRKSTSGCCFVTVDRPRLPPPLRVAMLGMRSRGPFTPPEHMGTAFIVALLALLADTVTPKAEPWSVLWCAGQAMVPWEVSFRVLNLLPWQEVRHQFRTP